MSEGAPVQHVVLFRFPHELPVADVADMRAQVAAWPEEIGGMTRLRFGPDLTGARTQGHSHLLFMEFAGHEELAAYQRHPLHQRFGAWLRERECITLAFDYLLDEGTVLMTENPGGPGGRAPEVR